MQGDDDDIFYRPRAPFSFACSPSATEAMGVGQSSVSIDLGAPESAQGAGGVTPSSWKRSETGLPAPMTKHQVARAASNVHGEAVVGCTHCRRAFALRAGARARPAS